MSGAAAVAARRALPLVDLTSLDDGDDERTIAALCARAVTPAGPVAAVCVYPRFVAQARAALAGTPVRVATVANFPAGRPDAAAAALEVERAVADGAEEVDVVVPWRAYLADDREASIALVRACRQACGGSVGLKAILETGALKRREVIEAAARDVIGAGADFVKTSTGKLSPGATLDAAEAILEAIAASGSGAGLKVSGGVRTTAQAAAYLELADRMLGPDFAAPPRFRFGASALLDDVLSHLTPRRAGTPAPVAEPGRGRP